MYLYLLLRISVMNFNLNQIREQFPALAQYHNDKPVTFF
ncbi:cysteine desulfurase [Vibrio sp. JCM 19053]|nr:cysteine desulfurase [Vibrio sp. JCM 19053]